MTWQPYETHCIIGRNSIAIAIGGQAIGGNGGKGGNGGMNAAQEECDAKKLSGSFTSC
ncbi:8009_t:CDS:2 [Ambispora leptoticha]|uniref:8009_t:CDS:1 n=1 Tax=Ambispora leptoticha TaxID=144679 RepID=A0A9N9BLZ8_9GLOM|nr:8009_t:CDS:2 [Ambispora leptoticha]